jgi:endonuclease YncB( thermonuclease family)
VVDGDTIDVMVSLGFGVFSLVRFRLARIDAPELKTPAGKALKERLSQLVSKDVTLTSYGRDRYGRWIAEIWFAEFGNVSDWLLEQKLVEKYGG